MSQPEDLSTAVAGTAVGKTVSLEVRRDGKPRDVEVTVAKLAEEEVASDGGEQHRGRWGLALRDLTPNERRERELEPETAFTSPRWHRTARPPTRR